MANDNISGLFSQLDEANFCFEEQIWIKSSVIGALLYQLFFKILKFIALKYCGHLKLYQMNFRILTSVFFLLVGSVCFGQVTFQPKQQSYENQGVVYNKEFTVDLRILQTNGFTLGFNQGKIKTYYKTPFYHFCLLYTSPSPRDRQKSRMPSSA